MRVFFLILAFLPVTAFASKPLFENNQPLEAVLSAPVTQTYKDRKKAVRLYHKGTISYLDGAGTTQRVDVKIRTRGNFRRLNCSHPPLRLNFTKKANDGTVFERQDKLKLVGPCKNGPAYQEYVGLEFIVYKIWEAVSPYHFKTRLIHLSYLDTAKKKKPRKATTFVIEDVSDVAKRVNRKRLEQPKVRRQQMNLEETALLEVFQLLIGNSDYSTLAAPEGDNCCHNARLLVLKGETGNIIPVPYDFDVSGFVDAPYAVPAAQYPIKDVRQRYFTGWCKEPPQFLSAIERFKERKARLYEIVQQATVINDRTRGKTVRYLDSFYEIIEDPSRVQDEVIGRCRGSVIAG